MGLYGLFYVWLIRIIAYQFLLMNIDIHKKILIFIYAYWYLFMNIDIYLWILIFINKYLQISILVMLQEVFEFYWILSFWITGLIHPYSFCPALFPSVLFSSLLCLLHPLFRLPLFSLILTLLSTPFSPLFSFLPVTNPLLLRTTPHTTSHHPTFYTTPHHLTSHHTALHHTTPLHTTPHHTTSHPSLSTDMRNRYSSRHAVCYVDSRTQEHISKLL